MKTVQDVLGRLQKVRERKPGEWMACCPVHDDRTPSLSIRDSGRIPDLYCFGCGAKKDAILPALDMHPLDFYPSKTEGSRSYKPASRKLDGRTAKSILRHRLLMAAAAIHDISEGRQPSPEELEELSEACADIFNILENVDAI